jgi:hypothetical protein
METTVYYDEYLRYFELAKDQQAKCNLGSIPYLQSNMNDDLLENVELYDVVERKFAGFSQIVNDAFYGWTEEHPYWLKMSNGIHTRQREQVAKAWTGKHSDFKLPEWLYVFIVHRITGSGINYSRKPSGYHNTILFSLYHCKNIEEMVELINDYFEPFYTSVGYQFPGFPKIPTGSKYKRAGDYYLSEFAPRLARDLAEWLEASNSKKDLREIGSFMLDWNTKNGLKQYKFQYAAIVADIADWYPQYVNKESPFYYGSNAVECISYLANNTQKLKQELFLDKVMEKIYEDTKAYPYNAEDVCCDFIRWVENYVKPGADYDHLNFDTLWSSCKIKDHPYGRQKMMLDLGLIKTFNGMTAHPSDDTILRQIDMTVDEYRKKVNDFSGRILH